MKNAILIELAETWELQAATGGDGLNKLQPAARETLRACADMLRMMVGSPLAREAAPTAAQPAPVEPQPEARERRIRAALSRLDADGPMPGMIAAFENHFGAHWTDRDYRADAAVWAAAWSAARAQAPQAWGDAWQRHQLSPELAPMLKKAPQAEQPKPLTDEWINRTADKHRRDGDGPVWPNSFARDVEQEVLRRNGIGTDKPTTGGGND